MILGDKPADSSKRRRLVDCDAKTIVGIVIQTFLHRMSSDVEVADATVAIRKDCGESQV